MKKVRYLSATCLLGLFVLVSCKEGNPGAAPPPSVVTDQANITSCDQIKSHQIAQPKARACNKNSCPMSSR